MSGCSETAKGGLLAAGVDGGGSRESQGAHDGTP